ncbi:hypothetical protein [Fredinandcohnia sp. 179-A 10B2 NHS]|uniref:hypothetical protein n=1 Tax=Fredinandcohnia sp. 179-A 10B2 NHS TaxID=3235176 RepID=UPI0039A27CB1
MTEVKELININRLAEEIDESKWKAAYEDEIRKLEQVLQKSKELTYNLYVNNEQSEEYGNLEAEVHATLSNPKLLQTLKKWEFEITDSVWRKRLHLMVHEIEATIIDSDPRIVKVRNNLQSTLMQREFNVEGQSFTVATINSSRMELPDKNLRRNLHQAVAEYGVEVSESFRDLILARNEVAQEFGYRDYHAFACESRGINFESYKNECNKILLDTEETWQLWENRIKERFGWEEIYSSDWLFAGSNFSNINQELFTSTKIIEALSCVTKKFGLDYKSLPIDVKVAKLPFGGACMAISPDDIRVVINERTGNTVYFTAFHEFGHALFNALASKQNFEFDEFKSIIAHEAMAEVMATISSQEKWLKDFWNLSDEEINEIVGSQQLFELVLMRLYYYYSLVEEALYKNPNCDYKKVADDLYQFVFGGEDIGYHPATELLFISHPIYVQDYIYADGIRDMLLHTLDIDGMYEENEAFSIIKQKFMEPGEMYSWDEKVEQICNEPFTFSYYGHYLATGERTI